MAEGKLQMLITADLTKKREDEIRDCILMLAQTSNEPLNTLRQVSLWLNDHVKQLEGIKPLAPSK